ncbi:dimethylarginine dimethylaminohydrolase family protein [Legionella sp. D16C41]|uniref:dimethylarginine dimethylaminohydrolase family protein n=1 Tax=Legionella sp. D16C41 TaxID=3402688 RepID=UPI003AF67B7E
MYSNVIVRTPATSLIHGLTSQTTSSPDYAQALVQHQHYINALKKGGTEVTILPAIAEYPDACFVEDVALLTEKIAILTRPGALTRQGEVALIEPCIKSFYQDKITSINAPGTLEAGDILRVNNHFYIGLSKRTNQEGATQLAAILTAYGYTSSTIELKEYLHLKTGVSYLGEGYLLVAGELIDHPAFSSFKQIKVLPEETYAANTITINNTILMPSGFSITSKAVEALGFNICPLAMSEFQKIDGGLSCLSLRF